MQLLQAKVRCVDGVKDTGWFVPGREATVLCGTGGSGKTALLRALQTLNPPYDIERVNPLANHPRVWHQDASVRMVIPRKKTAVYMVFSARPEQVVRLADIDADLIETDRIEIGRRLDNSRWTSFVELSAASRWRDIAEDVRILRLSVADREDGADAVFFADLHESDRIQGDLAAAFLRWLQGVKPLLPGDQYERYQRCRHHIQRRLRFSRAEEVIAEELPLTLYLDPGCALPPFFRVDEIMNGRMGDETSAVANLMYLLYRKYDVVGSGKTLEQLQAAAAGLMEPLWQQLRESGWPIPALRADGQRLYFANIPESALSRRIYLIALTCFLAQIYHGTKPVLLLDCFDRGVVGDERLAIIRFQQRLGGWCQVLVTTADEGVAKVPGWQSLFRIGPGGLQESGLVSS